MNVLLIHPRTMNLSGTGSFSLKKMFCLTF